MAKKENGAVFSHMAVMYANAYIREALQKKKAGKHCVLCLIQLDFDTSHIAREFLNISVQTDVACIIIWTGAASWYLFYHDQRGLWCPWSFSETFWFIQNFWQNSSMKQELLLSLLLLQENSSMLPTETQTEKMVLIISPLRTATKTAIEIVEDSHIMISREFINNLFWIFMKLQ